MIRWEEWGAAAFARARDERKPVLLSLTATWCHACHRMDDETWSDPGVAAAVERAAIPVRVDADARPDVYARFHLGGLPSTAVLTDAAEVVRGGTFLSPLQCLGFLDASLGDWRAGRLPAPRPEPAARPAAAGARAEGVSIAARLVDEVVERLRRRADLVHGGFGVAPKLPEPDGVTLLLRRGAATDDRELTRIARLTLDAIAEHLVDPDDGGFFRYGAAADWSGPHTEKLAVDQAALIRLYLKAAATLDEPRYADVARGALDHARRRLLDAQGRVLASIAAAPALDEHGAPLIDRRRFADAAAAMISAECAARAAGLAIDVDRELLASAPDGAVPHELGTADAAAALAASPDQTGAPPGEAGTDASAAMIGARPRDHGAPATASPITGLLDDQALAILAALDDHATTGAQASLDFALRVAAWSASHLLDPPSGAFAASPAVGPAEPALPPMQPLIANGRMALALSRLGAAAGRPDLTRLAHQVVESLAPRAARSPAGATLALAALALAPRDR